MRVGQGREDTLTPRRRRRGVATVWMARHKRDIDILAAEAPHASFREAYMIRISHEDSGLLPLGAISSL